MTDTECNKVLTLLMGECWHEWEWKPKDGDIHIYECKCGLRVGGRPQNPDYLSNPLPVIRWVEKEMPREWALYVQSKFKTWGVLPAVCFREVLNLRNLVTYLVEHPEWGEKEICSDYDRYEKICPPFCNKCDGVTGKIIHPALKYLRGVE
jgi:hypothetical protein